MALAFGIAAIWIGSGLLFYHLARVSWNRRWKDNSAPLGYGVAVLLGPFALGCLLGEIAIRVGGRK
jgi:hypothetical protein